MNQFRPYTFPPLFPVLAFIVFALAGCYQTPARYEPGSRADRYGNTRGEHESFQKFPAAGEDMPVPVRAAKLPWESWGEGRDLGGKPIPESAVLRGDAYVNEGLRLKALQEYRKVNLNKLSASARAATVYRIASMQLAGDKPDSALATLGAFFEKSGASVTDVDPRFSLLFAYAFGRVGQIDQSFAWFSRVNRLAGGSGGLHDAAAQGVRMLARTIPDDEYSKTVATWSTDSFIHELLGQESRRRASSGTRVAADGTKRPFWLSSEVDVVAVTDPAQGAAAAEAVAVLLPLTGRYAALGKATRNGIELAMQGDTSGLAAVVYKDTAGDRVQAAAIVQELHFMEQPPVIIGPLLSTTASVVADATRQKRMTALTLTKNADFVTGEDVFRLGPTTASQVETLFAAAHDQRGLRTFAFVYPDDEQSREFVEAARQELLERNLVPALEVSYTRGNYASFTSVAAQLTEKKIDAVFFPDTIEAATRFRYQLPERIRSQVVMLGTARWNDPDELRRSRKAMEGVMFVSPFFVFSDNPFVKQFQQTYKAKYGVEADFLAAQGFDAATLVLAALKEQRASGQSFARALESIDVYQGLTGEMAVLPSGEVQRRFVVVELRPEGLQRVAAQQPSGMTNRGQYDFR